MRKEKNKSKISINIDTNKIANQMREANEIKLKELMLQDRVNISRDEYERTKSELEYLRGLKEDYDKLWKMLKLEKYYNRIVPETVRVENVKNVESQKDYIKIIFEVDFPSFIY